MRQHAESRNCVFDSTFRPTLWAMAINDMTCKESEPEIREIYTEMKLMIWIWILRALYPDIDLFGMDDDGALAFRQLKYGPLCVAMHTSLQSGFGVMNTGGTFGDNTTPSNYDVLSTARRQLAQWFWLNVPNCIRHVQHLLPPITIAPPITPAEAAQITPAEFDSINRPPLAADGSRLPPPYNHQVDDNLYADIGENVEQCVACSALALYCIMGFPGPYIPDLLSKDKLITYYNHLRQMVGRHWDLRSMTVGMLEFKREAFIALLQEWVVPKKTFMLLDAAILLGNMENHTRYVRWANIWMAPLYNEFGRLFRQQHAVMKRIWARDPKLASRYAVMARGLPSHLSYRLHNCIAKEQASFIWRTKQKLAVSDHLRRSLQITLHYLRDTSCPWSEYIGFIIPRDPHMTSLGDASGVAGGAYCEELKFWFQVIWNPDIRRRATAPMKDPTRLQINCLEFTVVILQLAATITWFDTATAEEVLQAFPNGKPYLPILLTGTDNQVSDGWSSKGFTTSREGQQLLTLYSDILREHRIKQDTFYIEGVLNLVADDISRPTSNIDDPLLSDPAALQSQLLQKNPILKPYKRFLPSPELRRRLISALYIGSNQLPQKMPKKLGQLVHVEPTGCISLI